MKKLFIIITLIVLVACEGGKKKPQKNYAIISGKINNSIDTLALTLFGNQINSNYTLKIDKNGNFRDTLKLEKSLFFRVTYGYGNVILNLFLKNGMDVNIKFDSKKINKTITFKGKGSLPNNLLLKKDNLPTRIYGSDFQTFLNLKKEKFEQKVNSSLANYAELLKKNKPKLDSTFIEVINKDLSRLRNFMYSQYDRQQKINKQLAKGNPSPIFTDYVNYKGGTSSLADFRGKYVYIDLWATWCVPCIKEIPALENLKKKYNDKNIYIISISIDDLKNENQWRKMIEEKKMSGIQLLANKAHRSEFVKNYFVQGIPRFILIDPKGNIVDYNAPRPSDPKLIKLFNSLNI